MKKSHKISLVLVLILIFVIGIGGCAEKEAPEEKEEIQEIAVEVVDLKKGEIFKKAKVTGSVSPQKEVNIVPEMGGRVEGLNAKVGQKVSQGEKILVLKSDQIVASLRQAEAQVELAREQEKNAISQHENAKVELQRMEELFKEGAISKQQLDQARLSFELSNPGLVQAQIRQAEAAVELAKVQLENTVIVSPISGIVTEVYIEKGEMAAPGSPVAKVVNMDKVIIESTVTEDQVNKLKVGQKVDVHISAISEKPFKGTIKTINPTADPKSKTYPIEIEINNSKHTIKPGMFAEAELVLESKKDVLVVPVDVILERDGKKGVFVLEDGKAVFKTIKTGLDNGREVEIVSGLTEGQKLITKGHHTLTDGTPVRAVERGEE